MFTYDDYSISDATQLQHQMREQIQLKPLDKEIRTIAGADISFNKHSTTVYAGVVVLSYPDLQLLSYSLVTAETTFPYVSGYLAFREIPALLQAWKLLPDKPDVLILDGQGITHPRRMGIASHFGILEQQPTIGCAKSMLFGTFDDLGLEKFSTSAIVKEEELLGFALRTKYAVKPIYVSPGNLITVEESLEIMRQATGKYRIPEPTRLAHNQVNLFRTGKLQAGFHREKITQSQL